MFKHILLPTDGSAISTSAISNCVAFSKEIGASITGLHVLPEFHAVTYQAEMLIDTSEQFEKDFVARAKQYLLEIELAAKEAGVACSTFYVTNDHPYEEIIKAAQQRQCDLIMMASHGRKGVKALLMGSETQKVLTHSQIPVLVYR